MPEGFVVGPAPSIETAAAEVVWLGDSTAVGVGVSALDATLPVQVAHQLARPARLRVLARSGARVADVLNQQLPRLAGHRPTDVFISVGTNDAMHLTLRSRFRRDYGSVLAGLPASVVRVALLGVPDMGSTPRLPQPLRAVAGWWGRALANDIRTMARDRHTTFVDIAGGAGFAFRREPQRYFAADKYHPNDCGYRLWATVVAETVA
ncbi:MAG: SGNH/GDSL hydrolase family protein [Actinomycetota bacterium]|nr:SGNH/GDSL hydrolase family protein [Actinomycetota bacterium]